jgi:hypothetical protein
VFEHIPFPVERAFDECFRLLRPDGFLCITVPSSLEEDTKEHYPNLNVYSTVELAEVMFEFPKGSYVSRSAILESVNQVFATDAARPPAPPRKQQNVAVAEPRPAPDPQPATAALKVPGTYVNPQMTIKDGNLTDTECQATKLPEVS